MSELIDTSKVMFFHARCEPLDSIIDDMTSGAYWPIEKALERVADGLVQDAGIVARRAVEAAIAALLRDGYIITKADAASPATEAANG